MNDHDALPTAEQIEAATHCGHPGEELVMDPCRAEIYNEALWTFMCDDCRHERSMEV